jgi:PAS domain S-box-containing protein
MPPRKTKEQRVPAKRSESNAQRDAQERADDSVRAVAESNHRLRLAVEASSTGIWEWNLDSNDVEWSAQCYEIHGISETEFEGTAAAFDRLVHPEDRQRTWDAVTAAIRDHSTYDNAFRIIRPDGAIRWVKNRGRALYSKNGKPVRMVGTLNDITAAKEREEQLEASDRRFRQLADSLPQIVWTSDSQGQLLYGNRRWQEYTGLSFENALGSIWISFIHPEDRELTLETWRAAAHAGNPYMVEHRVRRADGAYRWLLSRALSVSETGSGPALWFGTSTDIEEQKRLAEGLREGDQRKDVFLATLGHELRNPLAAISNAVHILKLKTSDPAISRGLVDIIDRQSTTIGRLVDDLLDVGRVRQGKLEMRREWLPINQVIESAVEASLPSINAMQHRLTVDLPPLSVDVFADSTRLCQVITNLLVNSAKFTPRGGNIDLSASVTDEEVAIAVSDNGVGISATEIPYIFDLYKQVQMDDKHDRGGLGIGLSLAKAIAKMHEGDLEAWSEGPSKGSRFVVRLRRHSVLLPSSHPSGVSPQDP